MSRALNITITDKATPLLGRLQRGLTDRARLNRFMADGLAVTVARYITGNEARFHRTAQRLGTANFTQHYARAARGIQQDAGRDGFSITLRGEIFQRTTGEVFVAPVRAKWLAIPATAAAYGRRPGFFPNLVFVPLRAGLAMLVEKQEKRPKSPQKRLKGVTSAGDRPKPIVFYWLKNAVTLPQDRTLLPSDEEFSQALEQAAEEFVISETRESTAAEQQEARP